MAYRSFYGMVTNSVPIKGQYDLDPTMAIYKDELKGLGIPIPVLNAMSVVAGTANYADWSLSLASKNTSKKVPVQGYSYDDVNRYYFQYKNRRDSNLRDLDVVLQFERYESPYVLCGNAFRSSIAEPLSFLDTYVQESVVAMLFAIMRSEASSPDIPMVFLDFQNTYQGRFATGKANATRSVSVLYNLLLDLVDPAKHLSLNGAFFGPNTSSKGLTSTKKEVLPLGVDKNNIGYVENGLYRLASNSLLKELLFSGDNPAEKNRVRPSNYIEETEGVKVLKSKADLTIGMYDINPNRVFNDEELSRMLQIPDWYIPSPKILDIARSLEKSSAFDTPLRNVLLRGPSGSGKTEGSRVLSALGNLPYGVVTGHADMEFFDLTSMLIPRTTEELTGDEELFEYLSFALKEKLFKFPDLQEMTVFPDQSYKRITGNNNPNATKEECLAALVAKLLSFCKKDVSLHNGNSSKFEIVHSDLTLGLKYGWLVELQEMNTILKPGTLVGLNDVMERGQLKLITGETIIRDPRSIVVFTQNVGYEGTIENNQSTLSRLELKATLETPDDKQMFAIVKKHVSQMDEPTIRRILTISTGIKRTCHSEIETGGGGFGTREIIAWAKQTWIMDGDIGGAAEYTVIPSISDDDQYMDNVRDTIAMSLSSTIKPPTRTVTIGS